MAQLAQRLGLDLADAFTGHVELLADLFQRVVGTHLDAEAHAQHLGLARGERVQHFLDDLAHGIMQRGVGRRQRGGVLDEVAQMGVVVVTDRRLHGDGLLGDLEDLADLVLRHVHLLGQGGRVGLDTGFLQDLAADAIHLVDGLDHVHRNADGARLIRDGAGDGLPDPPGGIGGELEAAPELELVDGLHQANVAFLDEVEELQAPVGVLLGDGDDEAQVGLGHLALGLARLHLAHGHALVDFLQVGQRQHHAHLQVDELLLQILDVGDAAGQHVGIRRVAGQLVLDPCQVGLVAREALDEVLARHAHAVDADVENGALNGADLVDLGTQHVAQLLDHLGREADGHQLSLHRFLGSQVGRRLVAVGFQGLTHLLEGGADAVEARQRLFLQLLELGVVHGRDGGLVVIVAIRARRTEGHFLVVRIRIEQAVDDLVDPQLGGTDLVGLLQHLGNGRRACRDGMHHVLQTFLDLLGNDDLALAGEQLDRAHLAHVHAHRVGGATELGVHGGQCGLGLFLGVVVGRGDGAVVEQQRIGVGGLFIDRDAHVAEGADHLVNGLDLGQPFGQVVVDLGVGEEAPLLAQLDELAQAAAARFHFLFGHALLDAGQRLLDEGLFLGTLVTPPALGRSRRHIAFDRVVVSVEIGVIAVVGGDHVVVAAVIETVIIVQVAGRGFGRRLLLAGGFLGRLLGAVSLLGLGRLFGLLALLCLRRFLGLGLGRLGLGGLFGLAGLARAGSLHGFGAVGCVGSGRCRSGRVLGRFFLRFCCIFCHVGFPH